MATMRDVARAAGVSTATVSRVINGRGKYTADTEQRVRRAIEQLGFAVNRRARGLKTGSSGTLGILMRESTLISYPEIMSSALKQSQAAGFDAEVLIDRSFSACLHLMAEGRYDGMLFAETLSDNGLISEFLATGRPFVLLCGDTDRDDVNIVEIDFFQGGYTATAELIGKGHRLILFLARGLGELGTNEVLRGYLFALDENGIQYRQELLATDAGDAAEDMIDAGYSRALPYFEEGSCTAVLATDDRLAAGALRAARVRGLAVPGEVSIIGFGDAGLSRMCDPPLTSVRIPSGELGELGAEMLLNGLNRSESSIKRVKLNARLIPRESVAPRQNR